MSSGAKIGFFLYENKKPHWEAVTPNGAKVDRLARVLSASIVTDWRENASMRNNCVLLPVVCGYVCDPDKAHGCSKTRCKANDVNPEGLGVCACTTRGEWAKTNTFGEPIRFRDGKLEGTYRRRDQIWKK